MEHAIYRLLGGRLCANSYLLANVPFLRRGQLLNEELARVGMGRPMTSLSTFETSNSETLRREYMGWKAVDDDGAGQENRRNGGSRSIRSLEGVTIGVLTGIPNWIQQQAHDPVADVIRDTIDSEKKYIVNV